MSEYLNKKAVLEWLREERDWYEIGGKEEHLDKVIAKLQSGAFDADDSEVQRLRAALEMSQSELRWGDPTNAIERVEQIIDEALSTTTEPINAEKVERAREGDENDA